MNRVLKTSILFVALFVGTCCANWRIITPEYGEASVKSMALVDSFHFALVLNKNSLYKRKVNQSEWERVPVSVAPSIAIETIKSIDAAIHISKADTVYRSDDYGLTWERCPSGGLLNNWIALNDTLFTINSVPNNKKVEHLSLGSQGWKLSKAFQENLYVITHSASKIYVGGWGHLFVSEDMGKTWDTLSDGLPERTAIRYIHEHSTSTLLVSTDNGLYYSEDSGKQWHLFSDNFSKSRFNEIKELISFSSKGDISYALTRRGDLYELDLTDKSQTDLSGNFEHDEKINSLHSVGDSLWVGGERHVYTYGFALQEWHNEGSPFPMIMTIDTLYQNGIFDFLLVQGSSNRKTIFRKNKSESNGWVNIASFPLGITNIIVTDSFFRVQSGNWGEKDLFISRDNGTTWDTLMTIDEDCPHLMLGGDAIQKGELLFFNSGTNLFKSFDNGRSWDTVSSIQNVDEMLLYNDRICVTTRSEDISTESSFWYSDDNGESFTLCSDDLSKGIRFLRTDGASIVAESNGLLIKSTNSGVSWYCLDTWGEEIVTVSYFGDKYLICELNNGYYIYSENGGRDWDYLHDFDGESGIAFFDNGGMLLVMEKDALYRGYIANPVGAVSGGDMTKGKYHIQYRDKVCMLHFSPSSSGAINISLVTLRGQRLMTKEIAEKETDRKVVLDLSLFSAGPYVLQISTEGKNIHQILTVH